MKAEVLLQEMERSNSSSSNNNNSLSPIKNKKRSKTSNKKIKINKSTLESTNGLSDQVIKAQQRSIELSGKVIQLQENNIILRKENNQLHVQALLKDKIIRKREAEIAKLKKNLKRKREERTLENPIELKTHEVTFEKKNKLNLKPYSNESTLIRIVKPFLDTIFE